MGLLGGIVEFLMFCAQPTLVGSDFFKRSTDASKRSPSHDCTVAKAKRCQTFCKNEGKDLKLKKGVEVGRIPSGILFQKRKMLGQFFDVKKCFPFDLAMDLEEYPAKSKTVKSHRKRRIREQLLNLNHSIE